MAQDTLNREQETQAIHKKYDYLYRYLRGFILVIVGIWLGSMFFSDTEGYATNVFTELIGIIATYLIFDEITKRANKRELREQLLADLKSTSISPAVNALARLRREGWLEDDYFTGKDLQKANWEGAYVGGLNLENTNLFQTNLKNITSYDTHQNQPINFKKANLISANLQESILLESNFEGAYLINTRLEGASLMSSNLQNAKLVASHLEGALLFYANLEGADLTDANLEGVGLSNTNLVNVIWSLEDGREPATLPDGTHWTPEQDLERFTNPKHLEYEMTLAKINSIRFEQRRHQLKY